MSAAAGAWLGLALALVQTPSRDEFGCILEAVSAADRAALMASLDGGGIDQAISERLRARAEASAPRFGWEGERDRVVALAAIATIGRDELGSVLAGHGIEPAVIDRWFAGQGEALRTTMQIDEAQGARIVAGLREAGVSAEALDAHGVAVGQYLGMLMMLERVRLGLPLN